jgi:imidazolonepropionase-like amidohydrolase
VGATLFDGTGSAPVANAVILVAGGHIQAVGAADAVRVPRGAAEVRLDGKWVIPGLVDSHVHAERWMLGRFMTYGVTSVRDLGGVQDSVFALREAINTGAVFGPRLYAAGAVIDGSPSARPGATVVTNATEARRAIDQLVLAEASQAKIYTKIDAELLRPLLDEARTLKIPVAAHLGKLDAVTAARMGVRSVEHLSGVVEAAVSSPRIFFDAHSDFWRGWNTFERGWAAIDSAAIDRVASALIQAGTVAVPTLVVHEAHSRLPDPAFAQEMNLAEVPDSVRAGWDVGRLTARAGLVDRDFEAFRRSRPVQDRFVRVFVRRNGILAAGSGSPWPLVPPGSGLHAELSLLVAAGLSPRDAMLAATRNAARLMGTDSIGVLRPGAVADFLVLSADPLRDIANTRRIELVVSGGSEYRPDAMRRGW